MSSSRRVRPSIRRAAWRRAVVATTAAFLLFLSTATGDEKRPRVHALSNATVVVEPGRVIENATLVLRDGLIEAVGADVAVPPDAMEIDATGKWVYAGLIDADVPAGKKPTAAPRPSATAGATSSPPATPSGAVHPVSMVRPEHRVRDELKPLSGDGAKDLRSRRAQGFTVSLARPGHGVLRGRSVAVLLAEDRPVAEMILRDDVAQHAAFQRGRFGAGYPTSLMGAVATLRQAFLDARRADGWSRRYADDPSGLARPDRHAAWEAMAPVLNREQSVVFHTSDVHDTLLAAELGRELGIDVLIATASHEWEIADRLAETGAGLIVRASLPERPTVEDDDEALTVTTDTMRRYLEADGGPARLQEAGVVFALTTRGLDKIGELPARMRALQAAGLDDTTALAAWTTVPAQFLGIDRMVGTLAPGKIANAVVSNGPLFSEGADIEIVFVDGVAHEIEDARAGGSKNNKKKEEDGDDGEAEDEAPGPLPEKTTLAKLTPGVFVVQNATVWTQGEAGILENADVLVRDGVIVEVGAGLDVPDGTRVIDAGGKHVTPGLIDCHSHTAIRGGVNEGSNNITAEVRIRDAVRPDDINLYRQLAGGLTVAHLLHGSANSIGGQDAVIKLRWNATAADLLVDDAWPGIKFALGENPKRSNFRTPGRPARYPSTRMGVMESIRTRFLEARDYQKEWDAYVALSPGEQARKVPPRRDLQLEALAEILRGERRVHSHSYRQDEILALVRLAEENGFTIATFQHVLEGYKVADELAAHGAGASTFSDWWAYKLEAYDAIPHNGALMHERDVLVTFNSDSAELARRMNLEAAKAVRWGDVPSEEALSFVTLNAARQLGIEDRVGSLEAGKDADLVIWSGSPLSVYSLVEQTWVDGVREFDRTVDLDAREAMAAERATLLEHVRATKDTKGKSPPNGKDSKPDKQEKKSASSVAGPQPAAQARPYEDRLAPRSGAVSLVGGTVHGPSGQIIENGTVSFRGGRLVEVGPDLPPLPDAEVVDVNGKHVLPGFIETLSTLGLTEIGQVRASNDIRETGEVNPNVLTDLAVNPDSELIPVARTGGLTHALAVPAGGLVSGRSALIRLDGWTWEDLRATAPAALHVTWPRMSIRRSSPFGPPPPPEEKQKKEREEKIARLGDLFDAARAYQIAKSAGDAAARPVDANPRLEALLPVLSGEVPVIVHVGENQQVRSVLEWAADEGIRLVLAGRGDIGLLAGMLAERQVPVILTGVLALPENRNDPYDEAFTLARRLHDAGVEFAISSSSTFRLGASSKRNLAHHAAMAAAHGLPRDVALDAITAAPARILGLSDHLGTLEVGKSASLIVTDGDPLEITTRVEHMFIDGRPVDLEANRHERLYRRYRDRPRPVAADTAH